MKRASERGSSVITFLILMPLLAAIFALSAAVYMTIRTDAKLRHVCRVELLTAQAKVAQTLADLLALNPRAKALRAKHDAAEKVWREAPNPAAKAAALALLTIIKAQQLLFAAQQKSLLLKGRAQSRSEPVQASRQVSEAIAEERKAYQARALHLASTSASPDTAAFDVVGTPVSSITPDYQPAASFERSQTMRIRWHLAISPLLPEWMTDVLVTKTGKLKLKAECGATMRKEKFRWSPVLSAASL